MHDAHIQGPRREEKRVSPRFRTHLGQLLQVEELSDGHAPEATKLQHLLSPTDATHSPEYGLRPGPR